MKIVLNTDKGVIFDISTNLYGRLIKKEAVIDYRGNNFSSDSLWSRTLDLHGSSNKNRYHIYILLSRIFSDLISNPTILEIFQAPLSQLTSPKITKFLSLIDDVIDNRDVSEETKYQYSQTLKRCFSWPELKLADGGTVESCYRATTPRFDGRKKRTALDSTSIKISLTSFNNLEDLNSAVTSHYQQRVDSLLSACSSDIEKHLKIVEEYICLKKTPLSVRLENLISHNSSLSYLLKAKSPPDPFHMNARIMEVSNLSDFKTYIKAKLQGRQFYPGGKSEQAKFYLMSPKECRGITTEEILFCDRFLPRRILLACLVSIQLATGANVSTLLTLDKSRIEKASSGKYIITGIKTKTDKLVSLKITKRDHPLAYQALEMVLVHDSNITQYWERNHQSIFCSINTIDDRKFNLFAFDKIKDKWIEWHELEHFSLDSLRDLVAQHDYLNHKDPFRVQALLQHANVAITDEYLNSNLIVLLKAANINEFMRRLAPSIAFSIDTDNAKKRGFNENKIDKNLLFPVSKFDGVTNAISDQWLMNSEGILFSVDENAIAHCAYQKSYYSKHFYQLISANKERFYKYHLPRIIFCLALYKLIEQSEYKYLLGQSEDV